MPKGLPRRPLVAATILAVALAGRATEVQAQTYPSRSITIVIPLAAGATADTLTRMVADKLRGLLGQQIIIENRTGAGGNIGAEAVSHAAPDGYTLLSAPQLTYSVNHLLNPKLTFDPRAFEPISILATYPAVLLGRADLPASNIPELIAYAKAHPGKLSYASQGKGQIGHLTMELFKALTGTDIVHIPYRGSAPALNDLLGGQVDLIADLPLATVPYIQAGRLKLLAPASAKRLDLFPDVPTVAETLPGFQSNTWMALAAPPGTPKDITHKIADAVAEAVRMPDVNSRIKDSMAEPAGTSPEGMAALIRESYDRWSPVIISGRITAE
jgi:tripartite-type tricarboxylate transporter receptor subunit TctC